jgi:5-methylcytosine-specific restriction enzyme B
MEGKVQELFTSDRHRARVTFHPDYGHGDLVGMYKPVSMYKDTDAVIYDSDGVTRRPDAKDPLIDYRFEPGPLLTMLTRALLNPEHNFVLVIEEINRANAPAVFGDFFQLLDRTTEGTSTYWVNPSKQIRDYMISRGVEEAVVRLPRNMFLWATMNSADQGVLPLDAAFKRRWRFKHIPLNQFANAVEGEHIGLRFLQGSISWNDFRSVVNERLLTAKVPEDRLLGPFFVAPAELADPDMFVNKVLLYLRDDVLRHRPDVLFTHSTYSETADAYHRGDPIFIEQVTDDLRAKA